MKIELKIDDKEVKLSEETIKSIQEQLKAAEEKELPTKWEDVCNNQAGWYINSYTGSASTISRGKYYYDSDRLLWPTEKLAEACLALSQLVTLTYRYNGNEILNDACNQYYIIATSNNDIKTYDTMGNLPLSFKTRELRDTFLENFRPLIEIAKPLL